MAKHKKKIVLVLSRDGSKHTLETDAKTLDELKAAAATAGINTDGLIWYEGLNRIFLKDDELFSRQKAYIRANIPTAYCSAWVGRTNNIHLVPIT